MYVVSGEGGNDLVLPVLTMLQSSPVQLAQLVHNVLPAEQTSQHSRSLLGFHFVVAQVTCWNQGRIVVVQWRAHT